ncbi:MAG: hypothetical protein Roseis2KO_22970 [Roseivirga sp.]
MVLLGFNSSGLAQEVSKTNSTAGSIDGGTITRTVDFVSGTDLPVGTTINDINVTLEFGMTSQSGFSFFEELVFFLTSPSGTKVVLIYDAYSLNGRVFTPVITPTYTGYTALSGSVTVTFDQQATSSPLAVDPASTPTATFYRPVSTTAFKPEGKHPADNLDNYNGESPFGTWTLTIGDGSSGFGAAQFFSYTVTVNKSSTPDVDLSFQSGTSTASETGGSTTVVATLSSAAASNVTVDLGFSGTATNTDFSASSSSIVINAGDLTGTATLSYTDDALDEANETIIVDISNVTNANEGTSNQITATITDDDIDATVAAKVYLEGAFNGTNLNTGLNASIPTNQPYNNNGHTGTESAGSAPATAVDWVLVELREAGTAATATGSTKVGSTAGFLMNDGTIKATDGTSDLIVSAANVTGSSFYVVVYHRNHLPLMSANAISESSSKYSIDFTTAQAQAFGTSPMIEVTSGVFAMPGGDADGDGDVDATDLASWRNQNGITFAYSTSKADFNLDGVVNAVDRNDFQQKNNSKTSQVPGL